MTYASWHLDRLALTGADKETTLAFASSLSLIYGASNTGKSFALKALDFMLGAGRELPNIQERRPYNKVWLDLNLSAGRQVKLERGILGGAITLHEGGATSSNLNPRHDANNPANISSFLLGEMGSTGKKISVDQAGTHSNLTFRDVASIVLTDEIAIQSERSPIQSGDRDTATRERNVFKYLLTGEDDSAIIPVLKAKDFRTGRTAKAALLQELIDQLTAEIEAEYPDHGELKEQEARIEKTLARIENELGAARSSIRGLLDRKRELSGEITSAERRSVDIALSLQSFEQLEEVYESDIARLETLEEAGFLLGLDGKTPCPVCGAPPEAQAHVHGLADVEEVRVAAEAEIQKIKQQRHELTLTVHDTKSEAVQLAARIEGLRDALRVVESQLQDATPSVDAQQRELGEVLSVRDKVRRGLDLLAQRERLISQKETVDASKPPKREDTIQRGLSTETANEFAQVVSEVLLAWGFPGQKQVILDVHSYDLIIDGKERKNNGKGVRAITHAAFKVALLLYCRDRDLPHPGFLVLDTPLLTYRDPLKAPGDRLSPDEIELRNTDLRERFFDHLGHIGHGAQFIIFENVDPPSSITGYTQIETFTNDPDEGRQGFL